MKEIGKWLLIVLLVGTGMTWAIVKFLVPPNLEISDNGNPDASIAAPEPDESDTSIGLELDDEDSSADAIDVPEDEEPANVVAEEEEPTSTGNTEIVESSPESEVAEEDLIPAIAQAEDVVIEVPQKIEKGGVLRIYNNNDNSDYPDTIRYSPIDIQNTNGLYFAGNDDRQKFQEVSGFIRVSESGEYNFNVEYPKNWHYINTGKLRLEVSQLPFPAVSGGRIKLEEGLHSISLFGWLHRTTGKDVRVSWGPVGKPLEPVEIYREVEQEIASGTEEEVAPKPQSQPALTTEDENESVQQAEAKPQEEVQP